MDSTLFSTRKPAVMAFIAAIVIVGVLRLILSLAGVSDSITRFFSISVVILAGMIYFGAVCTEWRDRLMAAYVLFLPYTVIAVLALAYTWITGVPTIFQRHEHSMTGLTVGWHMAAMFIGGFSFEPLLAFALMTLIAVVVGLVRPSERKQQ